MTFGHLLALAYRIGFAGLVGLVALYVAYQIAYPGVLFPTIPPSEPATRLVRVDVAHRILRWRFAAAVAVWTAFILIALEHRWW